MLYLSPNVSNYAADTDATLTTLAALHYLFVGDDDCMWLCLWRRGRCCCCECWLLCGVAMHGTTVAVAVFGGCGW